MMSLTMLIAGVFFISGIIIQLDYWKYIPEKYEEIQKSFISKEEIKDFIEKAKNNDKILTCLKNRGGFFAQCLAQ